MKKTLYSLMLNDEVVREVDAMAHRMGTNRSSLINQILAEYVGYTTPERRINDVLSTIQELLSPSRDLVPFFAPNSSSMSLKSSLEYKYRPTVKYEVERRPPGRGSTMPSTTASSSVPSPCRTGTAAPRSWPGPSPSISSSLTG